MTDLHWISNDYFCALLLSENQASSAMEYFVDDIHSDKDRTIAAFLGHAGSEDFLWALVKYLGSLNARVAGNSAYILGTIAECELGRVRVIALTESRHKERERILVDLLSLLSSPDVESVMNAAGTIGTLAESEEGREWLLRESSILPMLSRITELLNDSNPWTASNAALVLARISISERGCDLILDNERTQFILTQLIHSLGADEAGRGMNSAFTIGRLCDQSKGRSTLLATVDCHRMVTLLGDMLCCEDSGSSKNACFAISCLAASVEGHNKILTNPCCDKILNTLAQLLSADDLETGWFSAMTLRTFSALPPGCLKLRELPRVIPALVEAVASCVHNLEMHKEVKEALEILKYLDKPSPPRVDVHGARRVVVSWDAAETRCGLSVSYRLLEGGRCVYSGAELTVTLDDLNPSTTLTFKLKACTQGDDSPFSDPVSVTTEEDTPGEPSNLMLLAITSSQLKVGWEPPTPHCGVIKSYSVYLDGTLTDQTTELSCILSGLKQSTAYEVSVCASTAKGKGTKATLQAVTGNVGDHTPSKPVLTTLGRTEVHVTWNAPQVPLGRITRYDVTMNSKVIYSGTDLYCTARLLTPNTEYTFMVTVITNEGRQHSKPAKTRTPKDEYDQQRLPLYIPPIRKEDGKLDQEAPHSFTHKRQRKKRLDSNSDHINSARSRTNCMKRQHSNREASASKVTQTNNSKQMSGTSTNGTTSDSTSNDCTESTHIPSSVGALEPKKEDSVLSLSNLAAQKDKLDDPSKGHERKRSADGVAPTSSVSAVCQTPKQHQRISAKEFEKLGRSVTRLNVSTFDPVLPSMEQRASTFIGNCSSRKLTVRVRSPQIQKQIAVNSGGSTNQILDLPKAANPVPAAGRFVPMQYRTQPMNLPNVQKILESDPMYLRRSNTNVNLALLLAAKPYSDKPSL